MKTLLTRCALACAVALTGSALAAGNSTNSTSTNAAHNATANQGKRPNILLIVADDLGYSDIGAFGGEVQTPNLDKLAHEGVRMADFYASPFCSPTRAMLMSGVDNHRVGLGGMAELLTPAQRSAAGYEGYMTHSVVTFPQLLRDAGYHTYMVGKWHLGLTEEYGPASRGFEQSFAMVQGGASHFGQVGIITNDADKTPKAMYRENGKLIDLPEGFYSTIGYTDKMLSYIDSHKDDGKPFFAYVAYTAPHWPLQAPDEAIKKYEGKYDAGYDAIRAQRLAKMKAMGLVPKDMEAYTGDEVWPQWNSLSLVQKQIESKRMAVYAAMIDVMDTQIGRLVDHLKETGQYDNTLIFFMSDNGADGNSILDEAANREWIKRHADNSIANTGRAGSFVEYGPGWAQVSMTPLRLYKAFAYEGGIAVPNIIVLPHGAHDGQISRVPAHVTDVAPTILQLAGVAQPGGEYNGRPVFRMQGTSMLDFLSGQRKTVHKGEFTEGWELNGRRAMRKGDWKISYANKPWGTGEWQLFHVSADRSELHDVAKRYPAKMKELLADYNAYQTENGVQDIPHLGERPGYSNATHYYEDELETNR
ncbi:arylsulfatase [Burkholderia sp. SRS-W-2-2016]|uniref:arylsulfatase n=1 Tax=Burkholderia sp. SRS-W-2-2016 TaxID=1926878 RepID=UPI00094B073B|nr:arylsulfatase [Burkholderia sp. SRS-W-2-2016]OLL29019.1 arylsulfatase [Burkholderia sp. SRS-W-2-2016]